MQRLLPAIGETGTLFLMLAVVLNPVHFSALSLFPLSVLSFAITILLCTLTIK